MLFPFAAQIGSFLLSRNLFTFVFGGQFLLNVHKSNVRNGRKCLPVARAFTGHEAYIAMTPDASIYQQIEKRHYDKYLTEVACSVCSGEY